MLNKRGCAARLVVKLHTTDAIRVGHGCLCCLVRLYFILSTLKLMCVLVLSVRYKSSPRGSASRHYIFASTRTKLRICVPYRHTITSSDNGGAALLPHCGRQVERTTNIQLKELSRLLHSTFDYRSEPEEPFCLDRQTWVLLESSRR